MKILVVDDDRVVLLSCVRILTADGHEVSTARSVTEARALLEIERFDMLLVDLIMPGRDGYQLIEAVKARLPGMPVVATSGYPTAETKAKARGAGASGFIAKPFSPQELRDVVRGESDESCWEERSGGTKNPGD